ncbi:MAG TPA: hypothetical protein VGB79_01660 [Allosphingosinicella sp.]|jgi:hypothetical protein
MPNNVSPDGSVWSFHASGSDIIHLELAENDIDRDASANVVVFRVKGLLDIEFEPDPDNPLGIRLVLTPSDIARLPTRGTPFFVKNMTTGELLIEGKVSRRGFA